MISGLRAVTQGLQFVERQFVYEQLQYEPPALRADVLALTFYMKLRRTGG